MQKTTSEISCGLPSAARAFAIGSGPSKAGRIEFCINDGGRAAAGFKGNTSDCVTRAIAIAANLPYSDVYRVLAKGNAGQRATKGKAKRPESAGHGITVGRKWFKDYMVSLGARWTPTMTIGSGCKVHLNALELPRGRLVCAVSKHYTAVIDGVINDTFDPSQRGTTIYSANYPVEKVPKKAKRNSDGLHSYNPERCVYGFWTFPDL